jgi:hypothetical protein
VTAQFRVVVTKKDERVSGADDATVVLSVPLAVAAEPGFDATVEFMRGRLKATGHTGELVDVLKSGAATAELRALATG